MDKVRAWELLNDPHYSGQLAMGDLYKLVLRAGYSEQVARRAAKQRGWDRLCANEVM